MTAPFDFDRAIEALRNEHEDGPGQDADATRWRIRESLDHSRVVRGRLLAAVVVFGLLGTGGVSWAYLSGRLEKVWPWLVGVVGVERISEPAPKAPPPRSAPPLVAIAPTAPAVPNVKVSPGEAVTEIGRASAVAPLPELVPPALAAAPSSASRTMDATSSTAAASKGKPAPARKPAAVVADARAVTAAANASAPVAIAAAAPAASSPSSPSSPFTAPAAPRISTAAPASVAPSAEPALAAAPDLYRVAHQLHFHGKDPGAALAAWNAYLASQPSGRFAVEARYNRAMSLVRLRRYRDALTALQPFARGDIMPAGYRQSEAQRLAARLEELIAKSTTEPATESATKATTGATTGNLTGESK